jgi:hypothetical protein
MEYALRRSKKADKFKTPIAQGPDHCISAPHFLPEPKQALNKSGQSCETR